VKVLLSKAEGIIEQDEKQWNDLIHPACSCIQNIVADSGKINIFIFLFAEKYFVTDHILRIGLTLLNVNQRLMLYDKEFLEI